MTTPEYLSSAITLLEETGVLPAIYAAIVILLMAAAVKWLFKN